MRTLLITGLAGVSLLLLGATPGISMGVFQSPVDPTATLEPPPHRPTPTGIVPDPDGSGIATITPLLPSASKTAAPPPATATLTPPPSPLEPPVATSTIKPTLSAKWLTMEQLLQIIQRILSALTLFSPGK
ncbi:MAG TPA: hypothetical protein VJG32_18055 [Anaerolineae bacterium]|nr:hypothetical protein [Anaerolineae bacterium]